MVTVFLDANILAKPLTRTLFLVGSRAGDFTVKWSKLAEQQAEKNLRPNATPIGEIRNRYGFKISPKGHGASQFRATNEADRQILADAVAAKAKFLITEDVDDFGQEDLESVGMSAIQPDLFLSHWLSGQTYQSALADISKSSRIPVRTAEEIHSSLGKLHPLLAANMVNLFPGTTISKPTHNPPRVKFRGIVCILCGRKLNDSESISLGIGPECVKDY